MVLWQAAAIWLWSGVVEISRRVGPLVEVILVYSGVQCASVRWGAVLVVNVPIQRAWY